MPAHLRHLGMRKIYLFLLLFLTIVPQAPAASSDDFPPIPQTKEEWLGRSFDATSFKILLSGFSASAAAYNGDQGVRAAWVNHQRMDKQVAHVGDLLGTGVPGILIGLAQYQWDRSTGTAHLKAIAGAGIWTYALKAVARRQRPGNSDNYQSWPSGHTSTAFATATSLGFAYGWKAGVPATLIASFVAASRLADDAHYFSDTLAGAAVGVWMGYSYAALTNISQADGLNSGSPPAVQGVSMSQIRVLPSIGNETFILNLLSDF